MLIPPGTKKMTLSRREKKMRNSGRNLMFSYGGETESARNLNFEGGSFEVGVEGGERDWKKIKGEDDRNGKKISCSY